MSYRPSYDEWFLRKARETASRGTCLRAPRGVGAVIALDNRQLVDGYVGSISGMPHCTDPGIGCMINPADGGCIRTVHAEMNALVQAAKHGVSINGATCYTWPLSPCWPCFKTLVNGGVKRFVFTEEYRLVEPQKSTAKELGIGWDRLYMVDCLYCGLYYAVDIGSNPFSCPRCSGVDDGGPRAA